MPRNRHAFTLIELLVVIAVIAILIGIMIPVLSSARAAASTTQCAAHLRELYSSQMIYAQQNHDRMAPVVYAGSPSPFTSGAMSWRAALADTLRMDKQTQMFECPARPDESLVNTYGINSCIMMPQWGLRTSKRSDVSQTIDSFYTAEAKVKPFSQMILFADKGASSDDLLRSNDGYSYFLDNQPFDGLVMSWELWTKHNPLGSYRHRNRDGKAANAVFMDGHVEAVRDELSMGSGHLFFGENPRWIKLIGGSCCQ